MPRLYGRSSPILQDCAHLARIDSFSLLLKIEPLDIELKGPLKLNISKRV